MQSIYYLRTILALIIGKVNFKLQQQVLLGNFEQHLESFVLNTQNAQQSARNQIIRLNTSKTELLKIFRGFRVFEYALWQKTKTRKCRKSIKSFLNKKAPIVYDCHCQKTAKKQSIYYLSIILALITRKTTFKIIVNNSKC